MLGFLIMCDRNKEKNAIKEAYSLLNQVSKIFIKSFKGCGLNLYKFAPR